MDAEVFSDRRQAGGSLSSARAPTLPIGGGNGVPLIVMNERVAAPIAAAAQLAVIPGATPVFEESGALDAVAKEARDWFPQHLT